MPKKNDELEVATTEDAQDDQLLATAENEGLIGEAPVDAPPAPSDENAPSSDGAERATPTAFDGFAPRPTTTEPATAPDAGPFSQKFRVTRTGLTLGGRVWREGDIVGYDNFSTANRDMMYADASAGRAAYLEPVSGDEAEETVPAGEDTTVPTHPQGPPERLLSVEEENEGLRLRNLEISGVLAADMPSKRVAG